MNPPATCDVVVIGGGPAGSLAATYLAQSGYNAIVLEKQKHPRFAVGENLIPDFWKYCDQAGVSDSIRAEGFVQKAGGIVNWHGRLNKLAFRDFGYTQPALHVERDCFDHILLTNARAKGAMVYEEVTVKHIAFNDQGACVSWQAHDDTKTQTLGKINCRFVIDASGQNALLGRQLGLRKMDDDFRFMSVWGYFKNSRYFSADSVMHNASDVQKIPPVTYVTALPDTGAWGWAWHIALRDSTSVGLILPQDTMQAIKRGKVTWEQYFLEQCYAQPLLRDLLADAQLIDGSLRIIRNYSYRSTQIAGQGYFMIGDAAGFIDPIFSVGVLLGMYSASMAAWSIDRILQSPQRASEIQTIFSKQIQARLELGRGLALPQYGSQFSQSAKEALAFTGSDAQSLMYAAALMTAREDHLKGMIGDGLIQQTSANRLQQPNLARDLS